MAIAGELLQEQGNQQEPFPSLAPSTQGHLQDSPPHLLALTPPPPRASTNPPAQTAASVPCCTAPPADALGAQSLSAPMLHDAPSRCASLDVSSPGSSWPEPLEGSPSSGQHHPEATPTPHTPSNGGPPSRSGLGADDWSDRGSEHQSKPFRRQHSQSAVRFGATTSQTPGLTQPRPKVYPDWPTNTMGTNHRPKLAKSHHRQLD